MLWQLALTPPPERKADFFDSERTLKLSPGEPRCQCRHGLYWHYLCGDPQASRCLTNCGCSQFRREDKWRH